MNHRALSTLAALGLLMAPALRAQDAPASATPAPAPAAAPDAATPAPVPTAAPAAAPATVATPDAVATAPAAAPASTPAPAIAPAPAEVVSPTPSAADITLYFAPDASTAAAKTIKAGDPRLAAAKPSADPAKAAAGWQTLALTDTFIGYAPANTSRKDLSIQPGTAIHQSPDPASPTLGVAAGNPETTLQSVDADWDQVAYPGPATVYFQSAMPAVAIPAIAMPLVVTAPAVPATPVVTAPAVTPAPVVAIPSPAIAPAAPAPVASAPSKPAPAVSAPKKTVVVKETPSADLPRYFYGTFKARTDLKISGPINAQYVLVSPNGQLVALVDMSNIILANPLTEYLGKPVKIYGAAYTAPNLPIAVVRAQMLQSN